MAKRKRKSKRAELRCIDATLNPNQTYYLGVAAMRTYVYREREVKARRRHGKAKA